MYTLFYAMYILVFTLFYVVSFSNRQMTLLNQDFVYIKSFDLNDDSNMVEPEVKPTADRMRQDPTMLSIRDKFAQLYVNKAECLIHGDLHNGSVMVKNGDSRVCNFVH